MLLAIGGVWTAFNALISLSLSFMTVKPWEGMGYWFLGLGGLAFGVLSVVAAIWLDKLKLKGGQLGLGLLIIGLVASSIVLGYFVWLTYHPPPCSFLCWNLEPTMAVLAGGFTAANIAALGLLRVGWKHLR